MRGHTYEVTHRVTKQSSHREVPSVKGIDFITEIRRSRRVAHLKKGISVRASHRARHSHHLGLHHSFMTCQTNLECLKGNVHVNISPLLNLNSAKKTKKKHSRSNTAAETHHNNVHSANRRSKTTSAIVIYVSLVNEAISSPVS